MTTTGKLDVYVWRAAAWLLHCFFNFIPVAFVDCARFTVIVLHLTENMFKSFVRFLGNVSLSASRQNVIKTFNPEQNTDEQTSQIWRTDLLLCRFRIRGHETDCGPAAHWLGRIIQIFFLPNQEAAFIEPFGTGLVRLCPEGLLTLTLTFSRPIFSSPFWVTC